MIYLGIYFFSCQKPFYPLNHIFNLNPSSMVSSAFQLRIQSCNKALSIIYIWSHRSSCVVGLLLPFHSVHHDWWNKIDLDWLFCFFSNLPRAVIIYWHCEFLRQCNCASSIDSLTCVKDIYKNVQLCFLNWLLDLQKILDTT